MERREVVPECKLAEIFVSLNDLGMPYDTQEKVVFRYCTGSCKTATHQYDFNLKNLVRNKKLKKKDVRLPCCRPSAMEPISFYEDGGGDFRVLENFSAKLCECL